MLVSVRLLFDEGRQLPKWREGGLKWHKGTFILDQRYDDTFKRTLTFAKLLRPSGEPGESDVLPPLRDAVVVVMKDHWLRVQGFEYDDFTKKNTYQTWHVEIDR